MKCILLKKNLQTELSVNCLVQKEAEKGHKALYQCSVFCLNYKWCLALSVDTRRVAQSQHIFYCCISVMLAPQLLSREQACLLLQWILSMQMIKIFHHCRVVKLNNQPIVMTRCSTQYVQLYINYTVIITVAIIFYYFEAIKRLRYDKKMSYLFS